MTWYPGKMPQTLWFRKIVPPLDSCSRDRSSRCLSCLSLHSPSAASSPSSLYASPNLLFRWVSAFSCLCTKMKTIRASKRLQTRRPGWCPLFPRLLFANEKTLQYPVRFQPVHVQVYKLLVPTDYSTGTGYLYKHNKSLCGFLNAPSFYFFEPNQWNFACIGGYTVCSKYG